MLKHENKCRDIEQSCKEELRIVEMEKNRHLEANRQDRERFDQALEDLRGKLENKNEALEIEIKAKINDNRILAEELYKMKEKVSDFDTKLDFQTKLSAKNEEESKWAVRELEKVKLEYADYRSSRDKRLNDLEIECEKHFKENEALKKENSGLKARNDLLSKENKKLEDAKTKVNKFVNEVVGINEALVNKVTLLQDKERSRLREKDDSIKNLLNRNHSSRMESPSRRTPLKNNKAI